MTTFNQTAFIPKVYSNLFPKSSIALIALPLAGAALLALTAQLSISLPFTPVPITGQTFGVALLALLWGRKQATASMGLYLFGGAAGLPILAQGKAFLTMGPTSGYLVGMLISTWLVGGLTDKGYARSFKSALAASYLGSAVTLTLGCVGLSFYIPVEKVLTFGLFPFLIGDLIKNFLAAGIASEANRLSKKD